MVSGGDSSSSSSSSSPSLQCRLCASFATSDTSALASHLREAHSVSDFSAILEAFRVDGGGRVLAGLGRPETETRRHSSPDGEESDGGSDGSHLEPDDEGEGKGVGGDSNRDAAVGDDDSDGEGEEEVEVPQAGEEEEDPTEPYFEGVEGRIGKAPVFVKCSLCPAVLASALGYSKHMRRAHPESEQVSYTKCLRRLLPTYPRY